MRALTFEYVSARLSYDPATGIFTWKPLAASNRIQRTWNSRWAGKAAGGTRGNGYHYICLDRVGYLAHRLAWVLHFGADPTGQLDHINGNPSDNRICNLRKATQSQNCANQGIRRTNTSGYRGVTWNPRRAKWQAQIQVNKKHRVIGHYDDVLEASKAYEEAAQAAFGPFYRIVSEAGVAK